MCFIISAVSVLILSDNVNTIFDEFESSNLVVISIFSPFIEWIGGMSWLINILGSSGDIYMASKLLKYKKGCKIIDRSYGFDVVEN
jgi:hypothetical protein